MSRYDYERDYNDGYDDWINEQGLTTSSYC